MFRLLRINPPQGWAAVSWELGIVTLGVVIALASEQFVQFINWKQLTRETDRSLRNEIQESVDSTAERFAVDSCLRTELAGLYASLRAGVLVSPSPATRSSRVIPDLYSTPWRPWTRGTWDAAIASNALNHMKPDRVTSYAVVYTAIEDIDTIIQRERRSKGELTQLSIGKLAPAQAAEVASALTNLDRDRADILVAGESLLEAAAALGVRPQLSPQAMLRDFIGDRSCTRG